MCTSNVTIPTVTERVRCNLCPAAVLAHHLCSLQCISSCSSMQRAQTVRIKIPATKPHLLTYSSSLVQICRDNTFCMCNIARSPDLEACFECIIEGIGTFADSIPHYIESLQHQTSGLSFSRLPFLVSFFFFYTFLFDILCFCFSLYCLL